MNRNLIEKIREASDQFNVQILNILVRYESDIFKTDEDIIDDFELAIDKFKASLSDMKSKVKEGIL